ncbi:MAG: hypothetical protein C0511_06540 [Hyphomicrobium sp.]|nr:hypothetical protein [Hyphomicrobium sp.]
MIRNTSFAILSFAALTGFGAAASAADFGGDCCADLEERIAELEATVARKGNRNVKLTVSGQLSHTIFAFDDGNERNAYVVNNSNANDRFRFEGFTKISNDLEVGYFLELGVDQASTSGVTQLSDDRPSGLALNQSLWYLSSNKLGTLTIGLASAATDDVISYNLGGTNVVASSSAENVGGGLFTRDTATGSLNDLSSGNTLSLRWRRFAPELGTDLGNLIRYDSPRFMGFAASASWGEDDFWDVALRYAHDGKLFRIAGAIGYYENRDENFDTFGWPPGGDNEPNNGGTVVREYKGSLSASHVPTGLFVSGTYVHREFSGLDPGVLTFACFTSPDAADIRNVVGIGCSNRPDFDYYWLNFGIRRNFFGIGWTSIYGEYARSEDAVTGLNVSVDSAGGGDIDYVTSSSMKMWGFGVVQHIAAAQMDLFVSYRRMSADVSGFEPDGTFVVAPLDKVDLFLAGSRIRF